MSQEVDTVSITEAPRRLWLRADRWMRWGGLALLALLIVRLDTNEIRVVLRTADWRLVAVGVVLVLPLMEFKTLRWQGILHAQGIRMGALPALLAYLGSMFIGFLTPGRLGEFIKAVHVKRDCGVPLAQGFSSVLADRLFDLYALITVGSLALASLALDASEIVLVIGSVALLSVPLVLFLHPVTFRWIVRVGLHFGKLGARFVVEDGILPQIRAGLVVLRWPWNAAALVLTVCAYSTYFGISYLLARALDLPVGFVPVMFAVALGSLVTLIPVSISGLGTREAAIIAYLDTVGVAPEAAISFSLLVFVTFYIGGGGMGAIAWWIKPAPLAKRGEVKQNAQV